MKATDYDIYIADCKFYMPIKKEVLINNEMYKILFISHYIDKKGDHYCYGLNRKKTDNENLKKNEIWYQLNKEIIKEI